MRKGPTSDAQERIFSWFALSLMPFLSIAISGGVLGLGNMVFTAALTAGVLQLLLIYGMLGITGTYRLAGNALRDLVLLLVCVVLLIVCTNYTWSKGHPASTISRGMGLFLCVLAVAFTVWMLPYFMGKNRKLQRRPDTDFVPAIVFTLVGLALAGLAYPCAEHRAGCAWCCCDRRRPCTSRVCACSKKVLDEHTKTSINAFDTCYWKSWIIAYDRS